MGLAAPQSERQLGDRTRSAAEDNRAVEGYSTFLRSGIDVLVADRTRVTKRGSLLAKRKEALAC